MSSSQLNHRLTSMDASFLYFEKKEATMHNGSVSIFEGEVPFEDFVRLVDAKIHLLPRYQQIVTPDPFNIGHPTWEFDPNFDVRRHIFKLQVDAPGGERELIELSNKIFTPMMDRRKPLWEMFFVYGLEGGNTGMIARIHHCMVDGASGVDLIKVVLDLTPEVKIPEKPEPEPRPPQPDPTRQYFDSILGSIEEGMNGWMNYQNGLANLSKALNDKATQLAMKELEADLPGFATPVTPLPFNRPCSGEKKLAWSLFPFAEARAIRAALGGTVNDVVLTMLSGAIAKYVNAHGQPTAGRKVRLMIPVSLRQDEQRGSLGNMVSVMPVEIPLDLPDAAERFRHINQKTKLLKAGRIAERMNLMTGLSGMIPASVQALTGLMANITLPSVNMVATNLPGPQIPLYALGKKMIAYYPYVPIGYALGCGCSVMSYDQKLYFGLTGDAQAMPDVELLRDFLDESYTELLAAANVEQIKPFEKKNITRKEVTSESKKQIKPSKKKSVTAESEKPSVSKPKRTKQVKSAKQ